jgi:hypothetical protein
MDTSALSIRRVLSVLLALSFLFLLSTLRMPEGKWICGGKKGWWIPKI